MNKNVSEKTVCMFKSVYGAVKHNTYYSASIKIYLCRSLQRNSENKLIRYHEYKMTQFERRQTGKIIQTD